MSYHCLENLIVENFSEILSPDPHRPMINVRLISVHLNTMNSKLTTKKTQQKRIPYKHVPSVTLGRLAIDKSIQLQGVGDLLVSHAMKTVYFASQTVGIHGMFVDAMNASAKQFYLGLDFIPLKGKNENSLFYPTKAIEVLFDEEQH